MPLFDAYPSPVREQTMQDARLNPILKSIDDLPENILFIVAAIDIAAHEQLTFIERIKADAESSEGDKHRKFEAMVFEKGFHGWLERKMELLSGAINLS